MSEQEFHDYLWQEIVSRAGKTFQTHKGASFTYHIKEDRSGETSGVLVIDGKLKRITRATVLLAYHRVLEVQESTVASANQPGSGYMETCGCIRCSWISGSAPEKRESS